MQLVQDFLTHSVVNLLVLTLLEPQIPPRFNTRLVFDKCTTAVTLQNFSRDPI